MSVKKRPDSPFFHYRFKMDGLTYRGSTKETNPGKARQFEAALMVLIREGGKNPHIRKSPLLKDFAPTFLKFVEETQALKPKSKTCYINGWRLLSSTKLARLRLSEIGPADVDVIVFPGGGSNANQAIRTLGVMLTYACKKDLLKTRPTFTLRPEHKRKVIVDLWMEELIFEFSPPVLRTILLTMGQCGMRNLSEVCRMKWEHIRWQDSSVLIPDGKTENAERWVPMPELMRDALAGQRARVEKAAKRKKQMPSEWVFPTNSATGHYMNMSGVWARMLARAKAAAEKRGLPNLPDKLVPYSFRHTFATFFLKASKNDQGGLKEIMGHSSMRVTERYLHPGVSDAAAVMDAFNRERRGLRLVKEA
jgi:site-specific recombinase XerD